MMYLLLLEDDLNLGRALQQLVQRQYRVHWLRTLAAARAHMEQGGYDLVLLDLGLPDGDGVDWLRSLRAAGSQVPVLVISARDRLDDRVRGLDTGADDYLVKPFEPDELLARIRVLLRRKAGSAEPRLTAGSLAFATDTHQVYLNGEEISLSPKEHQILAVLMQSVDKPVSRERLNRQLYGLGEGVDSNTLEVHIHGLRKLLGKERIETIRGYGYRLVPL